MVSCRSRWMWHFVEILDGIACSASTEVHRFHNVPKIESVAHPFCAPCAGWTWRAKVLHASNAIEITRRILGHPHTLN